MSVVPNIQISGIDDESILEKLEQWLLGIFLENGVCDPGVFITKSDKSYENDFRVCLEVPDSKFTCICLAVLAHNGLQRFLANLSINGFVPANHNIA